MSSPITNSIKQPNIDSRETIADSADSTDSTKSQKRQKIYYDNLTLPELKQQLSSLKIKLSRLQNNLALSQNLNPEKQDPNLNTKINELEERIGRCVYNMNVTQIRINAFELQYFESDPESQSGGGQPPLKSLEEIAKEIEEIGKGIEEIDIMLDNIIRQIVVFTTKPLTDKQMWFTSSIINNKLYI
jgi:TolA-binding protein